MPATMRRGWRERLVGAMRTTLPQCCTLCAAHSGTALICAGCAGSLPRLPPACPCCALPSAHGGTCGACLADPPAFDRSQAAFVYAFPLDRLVQSFKYHGALALAGWFAEAMLEQRTQPLAADLIVPVPLARGRQRERGFNQALELARPLARWTGIPLAIDAATRTRETPPQASLPWAERATNIRGAFSCRKSLAGKRVVVVDDVMTTGASLDEFAATLKRAGALSVENWLVARTLRPAEG
ncbi:MAG: ComF family protein [Betaproteobacteria bacterium]